MLASTLALRAVLLLWLSMVTAMVSPNSSVLSVPLRCVMYLTGQHVVLPPSELRSNITHVILAFMNADVLNEDDPAEWHLFTTVDEVRKEFTPETKIMVAIGGWGQTEAFSAAARTVGSRKKFAANLSKMVQATGADGVDVDWEYPGGNGEDYKQVSNSEKAWEVEAYTVLLDDIRSALGKDRLISAAVPGLERDMIAFTRDSMPRIMRPLDFVNIMTYDMMNRRDAVTTHHSGLSGSLIAAERYIELGTAASKINLGLGFYVKWFRTEHDSCVASGGLGCPTLLLEDPQTGADLGRSGAFSWHDPVPSELAGSFMRALEAARYDGDGLAYWDGEEDIWWTFDGCADEDDGGLPLCGSPSPCLRLKFEQVVLGKGLGGVFAWGLGEDAPEFAHLRELLRCLADHDDLPLAGAGDRLRDEL